VSYYESITKEKLKPTAIYPNRIYDKQVVEEKYKISEDGNDYTLFYTPTKKLIARGYLRIVYGDHGPYIEFLKENIKWQKWRCTRFGIGYYDEYYPFDGSNVLLYFQRYDVKHLKNPPKNGFQGNREEGYADYRVDRIYISPYDLGRVGLWCNWQHS
jgi:hypothetical protein